MVGLLTSSTSFHAICISYFITSNAVIAIPIMSVFAFNTHIQLTQVLNFAEIYLILFYIFTFISDVMKTSTCHISLH